MPGAAGLRNRLEGAGLILRPGAKPLGLGFGVGALDQLFFTPASGSTTSTPPLFPRRCTTPVWHQV